MASQSDVSSPTSNAAAVATPLFAPPSRIAESASLLCACGLAAVAIFRCATLQISQQVFDVDPLVALAPQVGVPPSSSLLLDAMVLILSAAGLLGELRAGRRVHLGLLLLALAPLLAICWHAGDRVEQLWRGGQWLSSMIGAVALFHVCRDAARRRLVLSVLLGLLALLCVRASVQVLVEHPETVRAFERTKEQFLAERGWARDSTAARLYEERLRQREATGWFGLANPFSSLMAAGAMSSLGLLLAARRCAGRVSSGMLGVIGLLGAACAALLVVNGSKGAIGALFLALIVLALPRLLGGRAARLAPWLALGAAALALIAVLIRGGVFPEGFLHERSLLFRWHYLVDAAQVFASHAFSGVGPDGFQEALVAVRSPRHPEEVASAHNVLADWLVSFGAIGATWVLLLGSLLHRAGALHRAQGAEPAIAVREESLRDRIALLPFLPAVLVAGAGAAACLVEATLLDPFLLVTRLLGIAVAAAVATAMQRVLTVTPPQAVRWSLLAALAALAAQAMIDMTMWLPGSLAFCAMLIGAVAAPPVVEPLADLRASGPSLFAHRPLQLIVRLACLALLTLPAAWFVLRAWPLRAQEAAMREAAAPLEAVGRALTATREWDIAPAADPRRAAAAGTIVVALRQAGTPVETLEALERLLAAPDSQRTSIGRATLEQALREQVDAARITAIGRLNGAWSLDERNSIPLLAAIDQWLRTGPMLPASERFSQVRQAMATVNYMLGEIEDSLRARRRAAEVLEAIAANLDALAEEARTSGRIVPEEVISPRARRAAWAGALEAWLEVARRDPCAIPVQRRVVYAAERAEQLDVADDARRRMLFLDEQLVLDPRKQLSESERAELTRLLSRSQ